MIGEAAEIAIAVTTETVTGGTIGIAATDGMIGTEGTATATAIADRVSLTTARRR